MHFIIYQLEYSCFWSKNSTQNISIVYLYDFGLLLVKVLLLEIVPLGKFSMQYFLYWYQPPTHLTHATHFIPVQKFSNWSVVYIRIKKSKLFFFSGWGAMWSTERPQSVSSDIRSQPDAPAGWECPVRTGQADFFHRRIDSPLQNWRARCILL